MHLKSLPFIKVSFRKVFQKSNIYRTFLPILQNMFEWAPINNLRQNILNHKLVMVIGLFLFQEGVRNMQVF